MSFGLSWGIGWGGGAQQPTFSVARAIAVASNTVKVTFTQQPLYVSTIGTEDAGNLRNWTLTREDTGAESTLITSRLVDGEPNAVELIMAGEFQGPLLNYVIAAENIESTSLLALTDPKSAVFLGMENQRTEVLATQPLIDLQNLQTSSTAPNGVLRTGTNGGYNLEGGIPLLKKLVYRRITTEVSEFYHLSQDNYGAGITPKAFYTTASLVLLQKALEVQILREREIRTVKVGLTLSAKGVLTITPVITLRETDQKISFSFPIQQQPALTGTV